MPDRLRIESYSSLESYKTMLEQLRNPPPVVAGAAAPPKPEEKGKVKAFIVDIDIIPQKPLQWIADLQKMTKELGSAVIDGTPNVLMMAYDGGVHRLDSFQHDSIDDLILKPLDKTLFLQKLEFLTGEGPKITPTFLFRAKTAQVIEIGRDVTIDEISEFAVSVRSPGPVPDGAFASIHCDVFGAKGARRLIGRVYESMKHPVREGEYLVRFGFFGITLDQLSTVRRFIKANQTQVRAKSWTSPTAQNQAAAPGLPGTAAKPALSKELQEKMLLLKSKKLAVIDLNPDTLTEAKSMLEMGFKGVVVRPFASYMRMAADIRKLIPEAPSAKQTIPIPAAPEASKGDASKDQPFSSVGKKLVVVLRGKTFEAVRFEPPLKKTDTVLGKPAFEWLEKPEQWAQTVDRGDREAFEEFINFVEKGVPGRAHFRMTDSQGRTVFFDAKGQLEKAGTDGTALIRVDLTEIERDEFAKAINTSQASTPNANKDPSFFKFEAILMDSAFLRPDTATWYNDFVELLRAAKVLAPDEAPPKIILMADPKANPRLDDYRHKGIADLTTKPLDRRYLLQKLQALCPSLIPMREPEGSTFVPCELQATLGREVTMEEISEYGVNIVHPTTFRDKSYMRFFSRLFGEEGQWVSGRFQGSEKSSEGESFRCQFMFFGPHDELLQRIRRWIREDYVAKKDVGGKN